MGKVEYTLEILKLLRNNGKMTCSEISETLGISIRLVKSYIIDLKKAGFDIETKLGRFGGYKLNEVNLNNEEWQLLFKIEDSLQGEEKAMLKKILNKVNYRLNKSF